MKIAIGGDHAAMEYKPKLIAFLEAKGHKVKDFGPFSDDSVDYPDFAHPVATAVHTSEYEFGVLICGSGQGVSMTANKHDGIRAALCWKEELAALSRQHNNANIVCLPARFISYEEAETIVDTFIKTAFEGGRHERRVNKIRC